MPAKNIRYRVMLESEDGSYCLENNMSQFDAELYASDAEKNYGDGQRVVVEPYVKDLYGE